MTKRLPLFLILIPHLILILIFFLKVPPVWPDEAIFMDTVLTFLKSGKMATNIFGGAIPGLEQRALWYPPFYFYLLAGWVSVFGSTIEMMRLLSVLFSFGSLIFLYEIVMELFKEIKLDLLAVILMTLDFWFIQISGVGRMDSLSIFLLIITLFLFIKYIHKKESHYLFYTGIACGMGIITHPLGLIMPTVVVLFILLSKDPYKIKLSTLVKIALPIVISLFLWLFTIGQHLNLFFLQYRLQFERKAAATPYAYLLFSNDNIWKVIFFLYFFVAAGLFIQILIKRKSRDILIFIGLIISTMVIMLGKEMWYLAYFQPFITLALVSLFSDKTNKPQFFVISGIIALLILSNCKILNDNLNKINQNNFNYHSYTGLIREKLPEKGTIFLSAIPDPYFDLKNTTQLTYYEFPTVPVSASAYRKLLDSSDYIVVNNAFGFNTELKEYIKKNIDKYDLINDPTNYNVTIIKFKPRNKRT